MSEPVSIRYKCKFCGNQQNKSLRSGPPNPGVCLKAPDDGKGWHEVGSRAALSPHLISGIHLRKTAPDRMVRGCCFLGGQASICSSGTRYSLRHCSYSSM